MTLWVVLTVMTVAAAGFVLAPLWRCERPTPTRAAYDLEIYRDQLAEVERDAARGLISADEAEAARAEIGRRALSVSAASDSKKPSAPTAEVGAAGPTRWWLAVPGVAAPALAFALYLVIGAPFLPGEPANTAPPEANRDFIRLVERLQRRMEANPSDPRGWELLGQSLVRLKRFEDAARAYGKAVALRNDDADLMSRYGETLTFAGRGIVTPAAKGAFDAALKIDPHEPRARYYVALADMQAGRRREALDQWRALEADSPPDAEWLPTLRQRIAGLAKALGVDVASLPKSQGAPGPTREQMNAAQSMSPEARKTLIRGMVARLAAKMKDNPDDFDGWIRLARSYRVLGELDKSRDAFARAVKLRPDSIPALTAYADTLAVASGRDGKPPPELAGVLDRLLALHPDNTLALWLKGANAKVAGDKAEAKRSWSRLLALLKPDSPQYREVQKNIAALDVRAKPPTQAEKPAGGK